MTRLIVNGRNCSLLILDAISKNVCMRKIVIPWIIIQQDSVYQVFGPVLGLVSTKDLCFVKVDGCRTLSKAQAKYSVYTNENISLRLVFIRTRTFEVDTKISVSVTIIVFVLVQ